MEPSWGTSSTLLERVRADEDGAWEQFTAIYAPLVYSWSRRAGLKELDAEDIVQETFRRVASGLANFRYRNPRDTLRAWLFAIARNQIRDLLRRNKHRGPQSEGGSQALQRMHEVPDWVTNEQEEPSNDAETEAALMQRALKVVESDFAPLTWQAFWLSTVEEAPGAEIATRLGLSQGAVRQAKFRVLARLREVLG
jgi:RNA polymerase sigma-70 factor (ECF subfamily)